jgi:hypothetical protein
MRRDTVSVLEGNTFVVLLTVDGKQLDPLSTDDMKSFSASFFLVPGTGSEYDADAPEAATV